MLFNSYLFLLVFLPVTWLGAYALVRGGHHRAAMGWLTLSGLVFYGAWSIAFLALLLASIVVNFAVARALARVGHAGGGRALLGAAVAANLFVLGWFKYANFFMQSAAALAGATPVMLDIVLPVGISFFTFTQIAYLVDVWRQGRAEAGLMPYALFVTWFPHAVAGPIIHHAQVMPQLQRAVQHSPHPHDLALGLTLFVLGLAKKVLLADSLAEHADAVFAAADGLSNPGAAPLGLLAAWSGVLAYALQLYFDFSGYSDMACGLSCLFGVRLPVNFNSPYKASSLIDFWRRWHISLSLFLRQYLYIPLGGNRRGAVRRWANLMTTMLLGGLWHGANWTFVLWGGLHGMGLLINHAWQQGCRAWLPARWLSGFRWARWVGWGLTFVFVVLAWVPFRAPNLDVALNLYAALFTPEALQQASGGLQAWLSPAQFWTRWWAGAPVGLAQVQAGASLPVLLLGMAVVLFLPNTHEVMGRRSAQGAVRARGLLSWKPGTAWALFTAVLLSLCLLNLHRVSPFLYFQF